MFSSWLPAISQKIEKALDENYVWTLLFLFTSFLLSRGYVMFQKKYFEYTAFSSFLPFSTISVFFYLSNF